MPSEAPELLIADDEYALHSLFRAFIVRLGYRATIVDSGEAAVAAVLAAPQRFRCVILDIMMPKMNGISAAQHMHSHVPGLPIVLITGWTHYELPADLPLAGYLNKPFTFGEFDALLGRIFASSVAAE